MTTAQDGGKAVSITRLPPLPPGNTPGTHFWDELKEIILRQFNEISYYMKIKYDEYYSIQPREICFRFESHVLVVKDMLWF